MTSSLSEFGGANQGKAQPAKAAPFAGGNGGKV
jgi:hypothetical protein